MKRVLFIIIGLGVSLTSMMAQKMVYLEHCETLSFDQRKSNAQLLRGNVRFRHEGMLMFCDSAYFYEKTNSVDAFGHVRFIQGDTLEGVGEVLHYDGNTRLARLERNVVLTHVNTVLRTNIMNYNRILSVAYYYTGGTIVDDRNTLSSLYGSYNVSNKNAEFKTTVHLENESFTLDADSLVYNTASNVATLVTPTTIVYEDETTILSSDGWYNTATERSMLLSRSRILHGNGKQLTGDTIYYDRVTGIGNVYGHMDLKDTVQKASLRGNYGVFYEKNKTGMATDSAYVVDWSQEKRTYMHADTLVAQEIHYLDSLNKDTTYRLVRAYFNVRAYAPDYQFVCDSVVYDSRDSIITLYHEPVCWSQANQLSADTFFVHLNDSTVDYIRGVGSIMGIKREGEEEYDQLKGQTLMGYIRHGELKEVQVKGNAETVFYPRNDDSTYVGVNKSQSSNVTMFIEGNKLHHVLFTTITTGTMYPLDQIGLDDTRLVGFFWAEQERPTSPRSIFDRPKRTERPTQKAVSASDDDDETPVKTKTQKNNRKQQSK